MYRVHLYLIALLSFFSFLLLLSNPIAEANSASGSGQPAIVINELRTDQVTANINEYVELFGPANASLDGLTYVVIGDTTSAKGSGVIEEIESLDGTSIPANGYFVMAESTYSLTVATITRTLNFENDDNVTHLLVRDFTGAIGDDLDTDDDGQIDSTPWTDIVDAIGLTRQVAVRADEFSYGAALGFVDISTDAGAVPNQVYRSLDGAGEWLVGTGAISASDTPGEANSAPLAISVSQSGLRSGDISAVLIVALTALSLMTVRLGQRR